MAQEDDPAADLIAAAALAPAASLERAAGTPLPVLYSFRRCPYAMRARMAIVASGQRCELREVVLRAKPAELLSVSPKGTVPVLVDIDGKVYDQSLEIMLWALRRNDPERWLLPEGDGFEQAMALVAQCDGEFKRHLDGYKYPQRAPGSNAQDHREAGGRFLEQLELGLERGAGLCGERATFADIAIVPFARQFAQVDRAWFDLQPWPRLAAWLARWTSAEVFAQSMAKFPAWRSGTLGSEFP